MQSSSVGDATPSLPPINGPPSSSEKKTNATEPSAAVREVSPMITVSSWLNNASPVVTRLPEYLRALPLGQRPVSPAVRDEQYLLAVSREASKRAGVAPKRPRKSQRTGGASRLLHRRRQHITRSHQKPKPRSRSGSSTRSTPTTSSRASLRASRRGSQSHERKQQNVNAQSPDWVTTEDEEVTFPSMLLKALQSQDMEGVIAKSGISTGTATPATTAAPSTSTSTTAGDGRDSQEDGKGSDFEYYLPMERENPETIRVDMEGSTLRLAYVTRSYTAWREQVEVMATQIFRAKCQDIGLAQVTKQRRERFVDTIVQFCAQQAFLLPGQGLGPLAAQQIAHFFCRAHRLLQNQETSFQKLDLSSNKIGDAGMKHIGRLLSSVDQLEHVVLHTNCCTSEGISHVLEALVSENQSVTSLDLSAQTTRGFMFFGPHLSAARSLARVLAHNTTLRHLNIKNCSMGLVPDACMTASVGLELNRTLVTLNLGGNALGHRDIVMLCDALKHNNVLRTLILQRNKLGSAGAVVLADMLRSNQTLTHLDVSECHILVAGVALLSDAVSTHVALDALHLDGNYFGLTPAQSLARETKINIPPVVSNEVVTTVQRVNLSNSYISSALSMNHSIQHIHLNKCRIGDEFVLSLCSCLKQGRVPLRTLELNNNAIGDGGAGHLSFAVSKLKQLERLDLSHNRILERGGKQLALSLATHSGLRWLSLAFNDVAEQTGTILFRSLHDHLQLTHCNLTATKVDFSDARRIAHIVERNRQVWEGNYLQRLIEQVERLTEDEKLLHRTRVHITQSQEDIERLRGEEQHLRVALPIFIESERRKTEEMSEEYGRVIETLAPLKEQVAGAARAVKMAEANGEQSVRKVRAQLEREKVASMSFHRQVSRTRKSMSQKIDAIVRSERLARESMEGNTALRMLERAKSQATHDSLTADIKAFIQQLEAQVPDDGKGTKANNSGGGAGNEEGQTARNSTSHSRRRSRR